MSWWDYGYQITAMANRTILVDNNTWNNTHISRVGQAMASTEDKAYEIMRELDVDYVLVIFGGLTGYSSDGNTFISIDLNANISNLTHNFRHKQIPVDGSHWWQHRSWCTYQRNRLLCAEWRIPHRQRRFTDIAQLFNVQNVLLSLRTGKLSGRHLYFYRNISYLRSIMYMCRCTQKAVNRQDTIVYERLKLVTKILNWTS